MRVTVITPPSSRVVTLEDAKKHLRVDHGDDDAYIEALVSAATGWLDGPAGWLGRALGEQVLEARVEGFGCYFDRLRLPYPPVMEIVSVGYLDADDVEQTVPVDQYVFRNGDIWFQASFSAPAVSRQPEPVFVRYRAGYPDGVPRSVWVAILMLVAQWYQTREPVAIGATVEQLPFAVEALLAPLRVYS